MRCGTKSVVEEEREKARTDLLDHQRCAALSVWIRKELKRNAKTLGGRKEHLEIDFAEIPRTPYCDLNQAFYSRILGVPVFIVVSCLRNESFFYFF